MPNRQRQPYKTNRKSMRKKRTIRRAIVVLILVLIMFLVALLVSSLMGKRENSGPETSFSSSLGPFSTSQLEVSSSKPAASKPKPVVKSPYDIDGLPMLANAENKLPENYKVDPVEVGNGQSLDRDAAAAYTAMYQAAELEGLDLVPYSGYRSHERQKNNYERSIKRYRSEGKSQQEAERLTQEYYAIPGTSEHEAGLAMDIQSIEESFENTKEFEWLQKNAAKYGFIMRYPKDKKHITGIAYEPWHYRFVGRNHAIEMKELNITALEEYLSHLEKQGQPQL